jgi:septal ring factor EnvC (AmiA/AmiB activator)
LRNFLFVLILCGALSSAHAEEIDAIREQIHILQAGMADTRSRHGQLQAELKARETQIGEIAERVKHLSEARNDKSAKLAELRQEQIQQQAILKEHRQRLAKQVRAAYIMGRQDYLKMLLNQEHPEHIGRLLTYYDYFNRARVNSIETIQSALQRLEIIAAQIFYEDGEIQSIIKNEGKQKQKLEAEREARRKILDELEISLRNQQIHLRQLQQDAQRLSAFMNAPELQVSKDNTDTERLDHFHGRLDMPVAGQVRKRYGESRSDELDWEGILITAPTGTPVRSIAKGTVVFADWLRNFGQVVIIDHGYGYMSLYGHNQYLHAEVGQNVDAGQRIASVGDSGGQQQAGLYFEIRQNGKTTDPLPWFKQR